MCLRASHCDKYGKGRRTKNWASRYKYIAQVGFVWSFFTDFQETDNHLTGQKLAVLSAWPKTSVSAIHQHTNSPTWYFRSFIASCRYSSFSRLLSITNREITKEDTDTLYFGFCNHFIVSDPSTVLPNISQVSDDLNHYG